MARPIKPVFYQNAATLNQTIMLPIARCVLRQKRIKIQHPVTTVHPSSLMLIDALFPDYFNGTVIAENRNADSINQVLDLGRGTGIFAVGKGQNAACFLSRTPVISPSPDLVGRLVQPIRLNRPQPGP
ncbi:MAG: hypothetical protein ACU83P_04520 [Gammaproteobacteria bacterium]